MEKSSKIGRSTGKWSSSLRSCRASSRVVRSFCVISLLGNIIGSGLNKLHSCKTDQSSESPSKTCESDDHLNSAGSNTPYFTSPLDFSLLEVIAFVILIYCSPYLHVIFNIRETVSSKTEKHAFMLQCFMPSWFTWVGSDHCFFENDKWVRRMEIQFNEESIPVKELALLGFVGDQEESERSGAPILKNVLHSNQIVIRCIVESLLSASHFNGESDRQTILCENLETIAIEIGDRIVWCTSVSLFNGLISFYSLILWYLLLLSYFRVLLHEKRRIQLVGIQHFSIKFMCHQRLPECNETYICEKIFSCQSFDDSESLL